MNDGRPCKKTCDRCAVFPRQGSGVFFDKEACSENNADECFKADARPGGRTRDLFFLPGGASFSFRRPRLPTTDRRRRMTSSGSRAVHLAVDPAPHTKLCDMLPTKSTATTGANKSSRDPTYLLGGDIPPATPNPSPQLSGEGLQDSGRLDCRRA